MDRRFAALIASLVLVFSLTAGLARAEPVKLNAPLVEGQYVGYNYTGTVNLLPISPNGWWVAYNTVDLDFTTVGNYYALTSGWLAAPLYPEGYLAYRTGAFSPNGLWFVNAAHAPDGGYRIYSQLFPPLFGEPIALSPDMDVNYHNQEIAISHDSRRVVYKADLEQAGSFDLYSVPIWGGTPIMLNEGLPSYPPRWVSQFKLTRTGRVLFIAGHKTLYSVPINGGTIITLAENVTNTSRDPLLVTENGQRVVFTTASGTYSVATDGGAPILLVPSEGVTLAAAEMSSSIGTFDVVPEEPTWPEKRLSPDGNWLVFRQRYTCPDCPVNGNELFAVPLTGGTAIRLNLPVEGFWGPDVQDYFQISPDSQRVVFGGTTPGGGYGDYSIFSVPITGGTPIVLGPAGTKYYYLYFELTPNSSRVVAFFASGSQSKYLGSVPISGGTIATLSSETRSTGQFNITKDSRWVVFQGTEPEFSSQENIYSVPVAGGSLRLLSSNLAAGEYFGGYFLTTPDSRRVLYCKGPMNEHNTELFSNTIPPWLPF
jgi:Tol biopolymer transport system component